jgi:mannose-1-phosphate guanylyltransferase
MSLSSLTSEIFRRVHSVVASVNANRSRAALGKNIFQEYEASSIEFGFVEQEKIPELLASLPK